MTPPSIPCRPNRATLFPWFSLALALVSFATPAWAQSIPNPSFEANTFSVAPGYIAYNTPITGWSGTPMDRVGLTSGPPFADNGAIPQGAKVAFVQSDGRLTTLWTTITGLTPGKTYTVSFRANMRRVTAAPSAGCSLNGGPYVNFTASPPVGGTAPYYKITGSFKATAPTAPLVLSNQTSIDSTLLVDDFSIVQGQAVPQATPPPTPGLNTKPTAKPSPTPAKKGR